MGSLPGEVREGKEQGSKHLGVAGPSGGDIPEVDGKLEPREAGSGDSCFKRGGREKADTDQAVRSEQS